MKNCLNCKYEPDWRPWTSGEYSWTSGKCKWDKPIPTLPAISIIATRPIIIYRDDSGMPRNCKTWEAK